MPWSRTHRTSFENALRRAAQELFSASLAASDAGDEPTVERLTVLATELTTMRKASLAERAPTKRQAQSGGHIPGQTAIS